MKSFGFWGLYFYICSGNSSYCDAGVPIFFLSIFKGLFTASTWTDVSGVNLIAPVMSLRASVCITYNLFTVASVAVISASQPHSREGFIYALHVPSVQQKSSCLKFSKSRTGSHVTYSCHHNLSCFTLPIFVHLWHFSVFHSLQSNTPRIC